MGTESLSFSVEPAVGYCPKLKTMHQITILYSKEAPPEGIWKWKPMECDYIKDCNYANNCPIFENATSVKLKLSN